MTQIICSWLNDELHISEFIDEDNFAIAFCNGYLIGEILRKYDLMDNFEKLSRKNNAEAKLNNFILLEPILKLLGIPFNNTFAKDVMDAKFSKIINLMYQLFIALENKKKSNTTALSMQTMQSSAITHIQELETTLYQERLKKATTRQSDLDLKDVIKKYQDHHHNMQLKAERERIISAEGHKRDAEKHRKNCLDRAAYLRNEQNEIMKKLEAAVVKIPKPPSNKTLEAIQRHNKLKNQREAESALKELDDFEKKQRNIMGGDKPEDILIISREESFSLSDSGMNEVDMRLIQSAEKNNNKVLEHIPLKDNTEYVNRIRERLDSDKSSRIIREKRRRKVLINCLKSHYQQEETERENMIAMRLMRQSQMEKRIAVQLLHLRHEKNVIKLNRLERETQYQERREKEFINALDKERELIQQMKLANMDSLRAEQELYDLKKAQHKLSKYRKHFDVAQKIIYDIVDYTCKMSEFTTLTDGKIPQKLMREWKLAFFNGVPLYDIEMESENINESEPNDLEEVSIQNISVSISRPDLEGSMEEMAKKHELLDKEDIMEYKQLIGEWQTDDESIISTDRQNNILNWIVDRLQRLSNPVDENSQIPVLPSFSIRAAVVGKCFSGKTMLIKNLIKNNRCVSIVPQEVIGEALRAYEDNEMVEIENPITSNDTNGMILQDNSKIDDDRTENQVTHINLNASLNDRGVSIVAETEAVNDSSEKPPLIPATQQKLSPRAALGSQIKEELMNGNSINDRLLVDCIIEYIRRIPDGTGWILDDFPSTYQQAKLFENSCTGYEETTTRPSIQKSSKSAPKNIECGLDVLILLNTSDGDCLTRAMTCSENKLNENLDVEDVSSDAIANLQTSLSNFAENWPKLSKFYSRINNKLIRVLDSNSSTSPTEVYLQVEMILDEIVRRKEMPEPPIEPPVLPSIEIEVPVVQPIADVVKSEAETELVSKEASGSKRSTSRKSNPSSRASSAGSKSSAKKTASRKSRSKSKSESLNSKGEKKASAKKEPAKKQDTDKRKGSKDSKNSRSGSGKRKKTKTTPQIETEKQEEVVSQEIAEPQPGNVDWVYAEKPISQEFSNILYEFWNSINDIYLGNCKNVFREIRNNKEKIIRYLYAIKTAFRQFLDRPDAKQEYLDQFQKDFNEIDEDWRNDEEVQQELHQRISELKEQLLEISQENQVDAEKEMETLKSNHWIEDQIGLISNQYLNLMQCEFDRFQDVIRFLKDYYKSMMNPQLDEFKPEFLRLPLIEIYVSKEELGDQVGSNSDLNKAALTNSASAPSNKKGTAKSIGKTSSNENQGLEDQKEVIEDEIESMFKTKINLIDYKTPESQITPAILASLPIYGKQGKGDKFVPGAGITKLISGSKSDKKNDKSLESLTPPIDLDERLLFDVLVSCYTLANAMVEYELSQNSSKEEVDKAPPNAAGDKSKSDKKGKGGKKSRTPTPKKGAKDKATTDTSAKGKGKGKGKSTPSKDVGVIPPQDVEETEQDKRDKLFREKSRLEYVTALQNEVSILRVNIKIIMNKGVVVIRDMKLLVESIFQNFSTMIADKLLNEDFSIKEIEKVYRYHVEMKKPLIEKVELVENKFYLNPQKDSRKKPPPSSRLSRADSTINENIFSIAQLKSFYQMFQKVVDTEDASISISDFSHLISESIAAMDQKSLPSFITQSTHVETSISSIAEAFSCDKEYVNWKLFLLACSEPWPWPTQMDLLNMLACYKEIDCQNSGFVTREQYDFVDLWFPIRNTPSTPIDNYKIDANKTLDRKLEIKKFFFDIFKSSKEDPDSGRQFEKIVNIEYLNYEEMLLHFAIFCTNNFYSGIVRALSVIMGENLPHIPVSFPDIVLPPDEEMDMDSELVVDAVIPIQKLYRVLSLGHLNTTSLISSLDNADLEDSESERDSNLIKTLKRIFETVSESEILESQFSSLLKHEGLLEWFLSCQWFKHLDLRSFFSRPGDALLAPVE